MLCPSKPLSHACLQSFFFRLPSFELSCSLAMCFNIHQRLLNCFEPLAKLSFFCSELTLATSRLLQKFGYNTPMATPHYRTGGGCN